MNEAFIKIVRAYGKRQGLQMIKSDFLRRLRALTIKEWCQLVRDPSSFAVGLVLPLVLIFIFGSGPVFGLRQYADRSDQPGAGQCFLRY